MRTSTASESIVDRPSAAISSPRRCGPRWNLRVAYATITILKCVLLVTVIILRCVLHINC